LVLGVGRKGKSEEALKEQKRGKGRDSLCDYTRGERRGGKEIIKGGKKRKSEKNAFSDGEVAP